MSQILRWGTASELAGWNRGLNEAKWAPVGAGWKWKADPRKARGVRARALAVYIRAWTRHADAFQRSRWAHQIRIRVFTLDLDVRACESRRCPRTPDVPKPRSSAAENRDLVISGARFSFSHLLFADDFPSGGASFSGVTCIPCTPPHQISLPFSLIFLAPKQLTNPPAPSIPTLLHRQAKGLRPPSLQSKFTGKWNPLYAKQTMRRK